MKKITITIIDLDRIKQILTIELDGKYQNLMEFLRDFGFSMGHCGGMALCASCHCYVLDGSISIDKSIDETAMLSQLHNDNDKSRLLCQVPISSELDGIILQLVEA